MKINIDGDIGKDDLSKIGTFLTDLYHGRKEHINVDIIDGTEDMSKEEVLELADGMFGDKPHFTRVVEWGDKSEEKKQKLPEDVLIPIYTCANRECACLKVSPGLYFFTNSFLEAEKHSEDNNSPMWISQIPLKEYISQRKMLGILDKEAKGVDMSKVCCICKKDFKGYGCNPNPIKDKGQCCDDCDNNVVTPARILEAHMSKERKDDRPSS